MLGIRLTWNKRYITLAPIATVLGLAFKLHDPDHLLSDNENPGITCALIPTNVKGVEIGHRHFPLNAPFMNGPTRGKDVFVPIDFIIGSTKMVGQGWRMLVECLSVGRGITFPSNSTGGLKSVAMATGAYARIRHQFKLPIGKMEGIEEPLVRIAGTNYLLDAASTLITTGIMLGEKPAVLSAIVKYHCTHRLQRAVIDAMDIVGGKGICLGSSNFVARFYQGSPVAITVKGANILTRSIIIYGQGAIRCHPYVLDKMAAARDNNLHDFDQALFGHLGHVISNKVRNFQLRLTNSRFSTAPTRDATRRYYQQINRLSANMLYYPMLLWGHVLGGSLKRRERISARLGDILNIFLATAALKRYEDEGRNSADLPLLHWSVQESLYQAEYAIDQLLRNFPNHFIAAAMRVIIFPLGKAQKLPSDKLDSKVAQILQQPSETYTRLGRGQYLTPSEHNPHGLMEAVLHDILAAQPIFGRICQLDEKKFSFTQLDKLAEKTLADKRVTPEEAEILHKAEQSRLRSINMDEFDFNALAVPANAGNQNT